MGNFKRRNDVDPEEEHGTHPKRSNQTLQPVYHLPYQSLMVYNIPTLYQHGSMYYQYMQQFSPAGYNISSYPTIPGPLFNSYLPEMRAVQPISYNNISTESFFVPKQHNSITFIANDHHTHHNPQLNTLPVRYSTDDQNWHLNVLNEGALDLSKYKQGEQLYQDPIIEVGVEEYEGGVTSPVIEVTSGRFEKESDRESVIDLTNIDSEENLNHTPEIEINSTSAEEICPNPLTQPVPSYHQNNISTEQINYMDDSIRIRESGITCVTPVTSQPSEILPDYWGTPPDYDTLVVHDQRILSDFSDTSISPESLDNHDSDVSEEESEACVTPVTSQTSELLPDCWDTPPDYDTLVVVHDQRILSDLSDTSISPESLDNHYSDVSEEESEASFINVETISCSHSPEMQYNRNFELNSIILNNPENISICEYRLPHLSWANTTEIWQSMFLEDQEEARFRSSNMFDAHPLIKPRMRAIVLDWLNEISEELMLSRETYYLSIAYLDRFLTSSRGIEKDCLQTIGITCLCIAAKMERKNRISISVFADLTAGNCDSVDIRRWECTILRALDWKANPKTPIHWLRIYLQIGTSSNFSESKRQLLEETATGLSDIFLFPMFEENLFRKAAQLLDLCVLDPSFNNFPYSISAAAAIGLVTDMNFAECISALNWNILEPCAEWMKPFYGEIQCCPNPETIVRMWNLYQDSPIEIQTHDTSMDMYDNVCAHRE